MSAKPFDAKKFSPNTVTNQAKPGLKDLREILEAKTSAQTHSESQSQSTTQNQEQGNTPLFINHDASTPAVTTINTQTSTIVATSVTTQASTTVATPVTDHTSTPVNSPVANSNIVTAAPEAPERASQPNTANQPDSTKNHAQASENDSNSAPSTSSPSPNSDAHESHAKPQGNRSFKNRNFRNRNNFKKKGNKLTSVSGPKPTPIN